MERIKMRGIIVEGVKLGKGVSIADTPCIFIRGIGAWVDDRVYNKLDRRMELFFDCSSNDSITAIALDNENFNLVEVPDEEDHDFFVGELMFEFEGNSVVLKYHTSDKIAKDSEEYDVMFGRLLSNTVFNIVKGDDK